MLLQARSPTRVDFAGGTLDCWPLYSLVGNCCTVNLAINVFTGCEFIFHASDEVQVDIQDLNYKKKFPNIQDFFKSEDKELLLVQKVLSYAPPKTGFQLKTYSQSPV